MTTSDDKNRPRLHLFALLAFFLMACGSCSVCPSLPFLRSEPTPNPNFAGASLGNLVTAGAVESGTNQARDVRNEFSTNAPIIYVVADVERVEPGTSIFARWSRNGEPFEDSQPITADRRYENTKLEFHIEPVGGARLEPGDYTVQLYINGNPGPSASFTVE
jgi:hypothetical protein